MILRINTQKIAMAGLLCEGGGKSRGTDTNRRKQQESRTIFFMFYSTTLIVFLFLFLFIRNMPMKRPEMDPDLRGAHPEIGIRIYVPADPEFGVSLVSLHGRRNYEAAVVDSRPKPTPKIGKVKGN